MAQRRRDEYAHLAPLLVEYASLDPGDPRRRDLRDRLVAGHLPVVKHIARRFRHGQEPLEDIEQAGTVGLIGAVDRFDPDRGIDFLSFAVPTITGEIRRHFRDHAWSTRVPRRFKELQAHILNATGELSQELGRDPRPREIGERLGMSVAEVLEAMEAQRACRADSLDQLAADHDAPMIERPESATSELDRIEYREALTTMIDELPGRDRTIILLRFFGNQTQSQIATSVGLSQMHVSRLLGQILTDMRHRLTAPSELSA